MQALVRRPALFLAAALVLSIGFAAVLLLRPVRTDAGIELLADPSSRAYHDEVAFARAFGSDPLVLVIEAPAGKSVLSPDHMITFARLEGVLAASRNVQRVYGPGTLVNTIASEVTRRGVEACAAEAKAAEDAARKAAAAAGKPQAEQDAAGRAAFDAAALACVNRLRQQNPNLALPALNNPDFYTEVLVEPDGKTTRPYWTWALPDQSHALITVRMKPQASLDDVREVERRIEAAAQGRRPAGWPAADAAPAVSGLAFHVSGSPALTASLETAVRQSLVVLLVLTLVAMIVVTAAILRGVSHRLIAVPVAMVAGLWTAGVADLARLPLTPATLAVLPVVLGLAIDYVLQSANRMAEETGEPRPRVTAAVRAVLPATALAAIATGLGVLGFSLSPIPLVRQFAFFLAIGVVMAYLAAVLVGIPAMAMAAVIRPHSGRAPRRAWIERAGTLPLGPALVMILLGVAGWTAVPHLRIETDPSRLMPAGDAAVRQAEEVRRGIGLAGELNLIVTGPDTSSQAVLAWMQRADQAVSDPLLRPFQSLESFVTGLNSGKPADAATTARILAQIPPYFTTAVITPDHRTARSVFGVTSLTSVEQDRRLVERLAGAEPPPAGYRAYPAGLAVLASQALEQLQADQVRLNLLALAVVLAILLGAYRRPVPALLAVTPTIAAAGWATGLLWAIQVRSSPITVLLAGVVVAFATEFSVLWLSRYRAELRGGATPAGAAALASGRVGPAIVASAAALIAGFGVLGVSPVPMVRDFGIVCAADLLLGTAAVLVLLPPLARRTLR